MADRQAVDGGAEPRPGAPPGAPRLLFLVTEDWYFLSHRLPSARAARAAGFQVSVATRVGDAGAAIAARDIRVIPLDWNRRSAGALAWLREIVAIWRLLRRERPDALHLVAVKPAAFGAIAALLAGVPALVITITGRGYALSGRGWAARLAGAGLRSLWCLSALGRRQRLVVQNAEDLAWLSRFPAPPGALLIRGSGVDLAHYRPLPAPVGPVTFAQVSRMISIKGVEDVVAAFRLLRARGVEARLLLAGDVDDHTFTGLSRRQLQEWAGEPGIAWLGPVDDVRTVWARAHVAVLASRRGEGLPKSLLEAAACGRPLLATDCAGMREVAVEGGNALLVPPGDVTALADAMERLARDTALRDRLAAASRAVVDPHLGQEAVAARMQSLYGEMLPRP